jgi:hypothetical protein
MPKRVLIRAKDGTEHYPTLGDNDCGVHLVTFPHAGPGESASAEHQLVVDDVLVVQRAD